MYAVIGKRRCWRCSQHKKCVVLTRVVDTVNINSPCLCRKCLKEMADEPALKS